MSCGRLEHELTESNCCGGWNPWHHPYTYHAAWCHLYKTETEENRKKNEDFNNRGGFYKLGYPED